MKRTLFLSIVAAAIALIVGCIVSDELTTITIRPDGSADWVKFQSDIHSTEPGAKGQEELDKFIAEFNSRKIPDHERITTAGGEIVDARWVLSEEPFATLTKARFATPESLENFLTIKNEKNEVIAQAHFTQDGNQRKLSLVIALPRDEQLEPKLEPTFQEFRSQQANGLSETRIAVVGGQITASQGFVVASDKRSCLIDPTQIDELIRRHPERVELFVTWELAGP